MIRKQVSPNKLQRVSKLKGAKIYIRQSTHSSINGCELYARSTMSAVVHYNGFQYETGNDFSMKRNITYRSTIPKHFNLKGRYLLLEDLLQEPENSPVVGDVKTIKLMIIKDIC